MLKLSITFFTKGSKIKSLFCNTYFHLINTYLLYFCLK